MKKDSDKILWETKKEKSEMPLTFYSEFFRQYGRSPTKEESQEYDKFFKNETTLGRDLRRRRKP